VMAASKTKDRDRKRGTLSLRIDHELHRRLKVAASSEGISMAQKVESLLDPALPPIFSALQGAGDVAANSN
jgi:predicted HicB family RNase H-like nuclease